MKTCVESSWFVRFRVQCERHVRLTAPVMKTALLILAGLWATFGPAGSLEVLAQADEELVVGPGKLRFTQTRAGRWIEVSPAWHAKGSLITTGGIAVFTEDENGVLVELVNTNSTNPKVTETNRLPGTHEGALHGFRAPSLEPDDDRDGQIDEDRLDGVDNDGDGKIDEDFAAIGDEMMVTGYRSRSADTGATLEFHEEVYAWSLPNIDGTIMVRIWMRNAGREPIENVHTVVFYDRDATVRIREHDVVAVYGAGRSQELRSRAAVSGDGLDGNLGLLPLPGLRSDGGAWRFGVTDASDDLGRVLKTTEAHEATATSRVYHAAPAIDRLLPGEATSIDFALVAIERQDTEEKALTLALATYAGDGENLFVPPPVSVHPRIIWARYQFDAVDEEAIQIILDDLGNDALEPEQVLYFNGIDPELVERPSVSIDGPSFVIHGSMAKSLRAKPERIVLKGRLETGEFFEMALRPNARPTPEVSKEAEAFWKTPGQLESDLLRGSPNPFRNATSIFYEIPGAIEQEDGTVLYSTGALDTSVKIYNVSGRLVSVLVENRLAAGTYSVDWAAVDDHGNSVASGVYYLKLQIEKKFITKRLILLK